MLIPTHIFNRLMVSFLGALLATVPLCGEIHSPSEAEAFVYANTENLDPHSRYITELVTVIRGSQDLEDLERNLWQTRGAKWTGAVVFKTMSLEEKLLVNLITNETELMRFDQKERSFLDNTIFPVLLEKSCPQILCLPSSHGDEAVSIALLLHQKGKNDFFIQGYDIQKRVVDEANQMWVENPHFFIPSRFLNFGALDIFSEDFQNHTKTYDLILCRNFLGYFKPETLAHLLTLLEAKMSSGSFLFIDRFVVSKHPEVFQKSNLKRISEEAAVFVLRF